MRRILLSILIIGALLLAACGAPSTAPVFTGGPRISFEQEFIDLGEATPEQRMHAEFRFQNVGDAPLIVYDTIRKSLEGC